MPGSGLHRHTECLICGSESELSQPEVKAQSCVPNRARGQFPELQTVDLINCILSFFSSLMDTPKLPGTDVKHTEACQLDRKLQTFVQYLFWPGLRVLLGSLTRPVQAHHGPARCQDALGVQHQ